MTRQIHKRSKVRRLFYFSYLDLAINKAGEKGHVEGIVNAFHSEGWKVTLFSSCTGNPEEYPRFPFQVIPVKKRNFKLINQFLEQARLAWMLLRWRDAKPDAIYVRAGFTMVVPYFYALWKKVPYFVEINAFAEIEGSHPKLIPWAVKVENWVLKRARGVFLVTKQLKDHFIKRTGSSEEKFIVMPNACDTSVYEEPSGSEKPLKANTDTHVVGFLGSFQVRQGVETLLRAVPAVIKEIPNTRFIIAGSGTCENEYKRIVEELDIADFVTFTGFVPKDQIRSMLYQFDVAVAPYHGKLRDTPMGSPLKIFTYLGARRVVVTSKLPALKLFDQCSAVHFATPDDPMDFARVIVGILRMNPVERREFGREGREFILKNYTWEKIGKKTSDFMLEMCGLVANL